MGRNLKRIALFTAAAVLVLPPFASATIVINRGMFGVSLGATMKQARQKLGPPTDVSHRRGRTTWFYFHRGLLLDFHGKKQLLHALYTENPKQRTTRGVGVGSTEPDVMRLVPGVQCGTTPGTSGTDCLVFAHRPSGTYATDFSIAANGRVGSVFIDWIP